MYGCYFWLSLNYGPSFYKVLTVPSFFYLCALTIFRSYSLIYWYLASCYLCIPFWFVSALSQWCVSHRKKAKQIVETWDKLFNSSQKEKCVSLLYLANDILQNSRRKGSEFVNEFWKVLPAALKHVYGNGDEHGKKVVTRLVSLFKDTFCCLTFLIFHQIVFEWWYIICAGISVDDHLVG